MSVPATPTRRHTRHRGALACLLVMIGCGSEPEKKAGASGMAQWKGQTQAVEHGGIILDVATDKRRAAVAEPIRLKITLTTPLDAQCPFPELGELSEDLLLRTVGGVVPQTLPDGRLRRERVFTLESYLAGEYEIPAVRVACQPPGRPTSRPTNPTAVTPPVEHFAFASTPFAIAVISQHDGRIDPTTFRDIKGPVQVDLPADWLGYFAAVGVLLAGAAVVLFVVLSRRRVRAEEPVTLTPHEWAHQQLDALLADDLLDDGRVQEFYYRLTSILRQYVERQFAITAPEMTTEEFLYNLCKDARLAPYSSSLSSFLRSCDLVKYAAVRPSASEIEHVAASARRLIDETSIFLVPDSDLDVIPEGTAA